MCPTADLNFFCFELPGWLHWLEIKSRKKGDVVAWKLLMVDDLAEVKSDGGPPPDWLRLSEGPAGRGSL